MSSLSSHVSFARRLTQLMDIQYRILGVRFGIDPLLDIIPGFGNIISTGTSLYLFWLAYKIGVPANVYMRMLWNVFLDYLLGVVPFLGILFDAFFRANIKNFTMLEKYFDPDIIEGEIIKE